MNSLSECRLTLFPAFEDLLREFVERTGIFFPALTKGRAAFFRDFSRWFSTGLKGKPVSIIAPEPALGLPFPDARQIISSAAFGSSNFQNDDEIIGLLEKYGLAGRHLGQLLSTLSGGELLLLNYARAEAQAFKNIDGLVACNPVFWLNSSRYHFWHQICERFFSLGKGVDVLALAGDSLLDPLPASKTVSVSTFEVSLCIDRPVLIFPEIRFPVFQPEYRIEYLFAQGTGKIRSPFLITGDNGIGKSQLARLLAGIHQPVSGKAGIVGSDNSFVRLLFQESIGQLFTMHPQEHLGWVFSGDSKLAGRAAGLLTELVPSGPREDTGTHKSAGSSSLLYGKAALIAEKLAGRPSLILLDEPAWGLSCSEAATLVLNCCRLAHEQGTAVGIISHQPHWHDFAAGNLHLERRTGNQVEICYAES